MISVKPSVKFSPEPEIKEFSLSQVESFEQPLQVVPKRQDAECQILLSPSEDEIRIQLSTKRSKRKLQNKTSQIMRNRLQSISSGPIDINRVDPNFMAGVVVFLETYTQETLENLQAVAITIQDEKLSNTVVIDRITEILHETLEKSPQVVAGICELVRTTKDPSEPRKGKKKRSKTQVRQNKKEKKSSKADSECSIKQGKRLSLMADKVGGKDEVKEEMVDEMSTQENISSNRPRQENWSTNRREQTNTIVDRPEASSDSQETQENSSLEDHEDVDKHSPALSSSVTQKLEDMAIEVKVPEDGKVLGMTYTLVKMLLCSRINRKCKGKLLGVDTAVSTEEVGSATAAQSEEAFEQQQRSLPPEDQFAEEKISLPPEVQHCEDMLKYLLNKSSTIQRSIADFIESALPSNKTSFDVPADSAEPHSGKQPVCLPWASARYSQAEELQKKKKIHHPWSSKSKLLASTPSPIWLDSSVDVPGTAGPQSKVVLPPIHQQEEAAVDYLEKRDILSIFEELMNRVVMCLPSDPLTFMIEHLRRRICQQQTKQNISYDFKALKPSYRVRRQYKPSPLKVETPKPSAKGKTPSKTKLKKQPKSKSALNSKSTSSMNRISTTLSEKLQSSSVIDKAETVSSTLNLVTSPVSPGSESVFNFTETKSMSQARLKKEPKSAVQLESSETSVKERKLVSATSLSSPKLQPKSISSINLKLSSADQRQVASEMDFNTFSKSHKKASSDVDLESPHVKSSSGVDLESLSKEKTDDKKSSLVASKSKQKSLLLQNLESPISTPASRQTSPVDSKDASKSREGAVEYSLKST